MSDLDKTSAADLPILVGELTAEVRNLTRAHRRKRISDAVLAVVVAALAASVLLYYFVELPDRRNAIQDQIRDLACSAVKLRPPGFSETYDQIRRDYDCPPFNPADVPDTNRPTATRSVAVPGPTVTRTSSPRPAVTATRTPGAVAPATTTRTATVTAPPRLAATRTVVRTRTATVTVTATPRCVLLRLVCP